MNLQNLNLVELSALEKKETEGGNWGVILTAIGMAAAGTAWVFEKGESFGKKLASRY